LLKANLDSSTDLDVAEAFAVDIMGEAIMAVTLEVVTAILLN
jgi:hypothetical protein